MIGSESESLFGQIGRRADGESDGDCDGHGAAAVDGPRRRDSEGGRERGRAGEATARRAAADRMKEGGTKSGDGSDFFCSPADERTGTFFSAPFSPIREERRIRPLL